ncbi:MAG: PilZ domain-containing protein [Planctomycetota bacterium]|nr:PilZ domain-containing protein [Planctomycetota bacterium]
MAMSDPDPVELGERRRNLRRPSSATVRLRFGAEAIEGRAENVAPGGVLFFTEGEVRVEVELLEDGVSRTVTGHLVRSERIEGERRGWAVELD